MRMVMKDRDGLIHDAESYSRDVESWQMERFERKFGPQTNASATVEQVHSEAIPRLLPLETAW